MVEPSIQSTQTTADRDAVLRKAKDSPELAGQHEKERWLALYSDDAVLEDPVGTPASHKGRRKGRLGDEVGRFYEAFIGPSAIEMLVRQDIVSGMQVFRAVDIHTTNLTTGLKMVVPANLLYEIVSRDGGLRIRRMQAHWELNRVSRMLMSKGMLGMRTIAAMNWSMLRAFGPKWLLAYFKSSQEGVGRRGKELVEALLAGAAPGRDGVFAADARIDLPGAASASAKEFTEGVGDVALRDVLASGRTVSGLASIEWGGRSREAGFIAELNAAAEQVQRLRWFWES